ncbi:hypothetical protein [Vibrio crassostreae]|uniref:hypothetical protein n=1 Tax=Vibrio crassostreae TaxID=246167 RepID=UPI001B300394|nr:hypothetical protein [Vibrio crassostreae]
MSPQDFLPSTDDDVIIQRLELRVRGKKPLVLEDPSTERLMRGIMGYLRVSHLKAKGVLVEAVINTPDPEIEEYIEAQKTIAYLNANLSNK